jgi:hypothetical protein
MVSSCSSSSEIPEQVVAIPTQTAAINLLVSPVRATLPSTQNLIDTSLPVQPDRTPITTNPQVENTSVPIIDPMNTPTQIPPDYWKSLPIIPTVSENTREIYNHGVELGRDPHAFSKIGDCQSITTYFLKYFDVPGSYNLGYFNNLQETINWFSGSFSRESMSAKGGYNAAAVLSPLRADPKLCHPNENPIACEFRLHNPSIAIISLEEWWSDHPENYESYMRQIIEYSIQNGVVPILATKADNLEGNHIINQTIARLSIEYDIPLWNFWLAVQPLPNHGLIALDESGKVDMFHLTRREGYYFFNNRIARKSGWAIRNLTALQVLDAVRQGLFDQPK